MALKIRLRRVGGNNKLSFRVVVCDSRRPNAGRYIENVGWYDPRQKDVNYKLNLPRIEHWHSKGAQLSDTVKSLVRKARKLAPAASTAASTPAASA